MQYDQFLKHVSQSEGVNNRADAERATTAVIEILGQRLKGGEPAKLGGQLPEEIKVGLQQHTGAAESFGLEEFFRRVAAQEGQGCTPDQAQDHTHAVMSTVVEAVTEGEIDSLRSQLPAEYQSLLV